jgi:hypothetical protein
MMERTLDRCKGHIDFVWLGEDLGTQISPMISLELYRKTIKPIHKQFIDLAASYGLPAIMHSCGSSSWVYEDLIELGLRGVDTLQPEAVNMSPAYLAEHFGGRLNFRGCISTAGPLAYGTADETDRICRETLARDGKFIYPVMEVAYGPAEPLTDAQCHLSPALLESRSELLPEFLERVIGGLEITVNGLSRSGGEKYEYYKKILQEVKDLMEGAAV